MPGYIPRYCIECFFFKQVGESAGRCLAWRNDRSPYARICRRFVEYKHFNSFTGELVESNLSKSTQKGGDTNENLSQLRLQK